MTNQTIPKRSEVPEEMTWNLKDMFASDEAWMTEYEAMKAFPAKIAAFQGTLARSAGDLLAWFRLQDEIELRLSVLMGYASCKGDEDTGNSFYQDVRGKAMNVYVSIASAAAFATPEIMAIPEEALNGFYAQEPELETYRRSLYQIRRRKDHILSPAEERLLASAGEMANASENIAGVFRNADQIFPDVTDSQGSVHPLTDATFVPLLTSPDRELRRRAFETYYKQLGQYKNTIAATLDGQFKQLCFFANARHYDSTIQASLDATEVPVPVYMNLIEAVHNNLDKMYRYVALRKKLLEDGLIHIRWKEKPLCSVDRDGIVRFRPADITGPEVDRQLRTVIQTAGHVKEYMRIFERAPALKVVGLDDTYKVFADFGDAVLAGQLGKKGARFVTWEWDFDRRGVHAGHYFMENYEAAKKDFAVRAGLVESQRLFSDEQIAVIKNACEFALEDDATLSYAEEKQLHSVQEQIELLLPQQERNQHPTMEQTM